jgi:hypothetical protein
MGEGLIPLSPSFSHISGEARNDLQRGRIPHIALIGWVWVGQTCAASTGIDGCGSATLLYFVPRGIYSLNMSL